MCPIIIMAFLGSTRVVIFQWEVLDFFSNLSFHMNKTLDIWFKVPVLAIMVCVPLLLFWFSPERGVYCFRVLFWWQTKASEFSTSQKWLPRDRSVQCSMGNTGSLSLQLS